MYSSGRAPCCGFQRIAHQQPCARSPDAACRLCTRQSSRVTIVAQQRWRDAAAFPLATAIPRAGRALVHHRRHGVAVRAANSPDTTGQVQRLPIFPLGIVAFPAATVPLRIFEARYRVLFNTLLAGAENLEEGLINWDSPFCGTRKFGMAYINNRGEMAAIGTLLDVQSCERLDSGQMLIGNKGVQRFQIVNVVEMQPVLICDVRMLDEGPDDEPERAAQLAAEVSSLLRDSLKLNLKMRRQGMTEELLEPPELSTLAPRELSFWVTSLFQDSPQQQQELLQVDSTVARLARVREVLEGTLKYLSATSALESAFASPGEPSEPPPTPPAGGPD